MELLSTWRDIVDLIPQLWDSENRQLINLKSKQDLMVAIMAADNTIKGELGRIYSDFSASSAWYKPPVNEQGNNNKASSLLPLLTLGADVKTEVITLTFNNASGFTAVGDLSGSLGTGSKYTTFSTSTLTIPSSAWFGTHSFGDIVYIRTYLSDPTVADSCSAPLAAANVLDSIYTDQIPNSLDTSNKYREMAMRVIGRLREQRAYLQKPPIEVDLSYEKINYDISPTGEDQTEYL